jgi:hypothetical protein
MLRFKNLNQAQRGTINRQRFIAADANMMIHFRFRDITDIKSFSAPNDL